MRRVLLALLALIAPASAQQFPAPFFFVNGANPYPICVQVPSVFLNGAPCIPFGSVDIMSRRFSFSGMNPFANQTGPGNQFVTGTDINGNFTYAPVLGSALPNPLIINDLQVLTSASGAGLDAYLASPAPIGSVAPNTGAFTDLTAFGTVSGSGINSLFSSPPPIGNGVPSSAAFTTLSATGAVSGSGFDAFLASPPAIGGTAPNTGAFTTLSATGAVSGSGFDAFLASPPAVGSTAPGTGAFTTLSATSTVSGAGFTSRFSAPGPIGDVTPSTGAFTNLSASGTVSGAGFEVLLPADTPKGRLTLTTGTPVMTSTVSAATTIYYTPYVGNRIPLWNGSSFVSTTFSEVSQATTDTTKSPAAVAATAVYDLFGWSDAGTSRVTRGPAWTSATARGTGAGTSELTRVQGVLVNAVAITNGPAAGFGTYLGSVASNGTSTIDYTFGSAASGGGEARLMVWNMYNRVTALGDVSDNGANYTYTTATVRAARASNTNRVTFVSGLAEDAASSHYSVVELCTAAAGANLQTGLGLDTTSAFSSTQSVGYGVGAVATFGLTSSLIIAPQLGVHFIQAVEQGDGTNANTFDASGLNRLMVQVHN